MVLSGLKIAFGGGLQPWEVVRVIIGIWIPWVMLQFYTTNIPGMVHDLPTHDRGGRQLAELIYSLTTLFPRSKENSQSSLGSLRKNQEAAVESGDIIDVLT